MNAFSVVKPVPYNPDKDIMRKYPIEVYFEMNHLEDSILDEVKEGKKTVKEALSEYELRGQEILDRQNQ